MIVDNGVNSGDTTRKKVNICSIETMTSPIFELAAVILVTQSLITN